MKIRIKKKNIGKFTATKKRTGKTTEELTHSKNPLTRKRAIFAQNAKKWSHKHPDGGYLDYFDTATSNLLGQNANYNSIYNNTIGAINANKQRRLQEQDYTNLLTQYQLEAETPVIVDFNGNNVTPMHYTNKGDTAYEGATPKFVTVTPGQGTDSTSGNSTNNIGFTFDRDLMLPITSGLNVLTDVLGVTNTADYSNANRIERDVMQPTLVGYTPTGRYVKPKLVDQNYIATRIANQGNTGISAAKDLSSGSSATALANIMAQNYNTQQAIGNAMAQSEAVNNKALQDAIAFNNAVDRANVEGALKADMANQSILEDYARRHAAQTTAAANLREAIDNQVNVNRSANWNNFLENLQGYFDNQRNRTMANDALSRIYGYNIQSDGHILFTNNNKKKTFANDYDINISDVDKVTEKDGDFYLNGKKLTRKGE